MSRTPLREPEQGPAVANPVANPVAGTGEARRAARPGPVRDALLRDALMVALTALTGATDAIAFTSLGGVFTSVMTGNMVLLGMGVGRGEFAIFRHAGLALVSYIVGTTVGTHLVGPKRSDDGIWPRGLTRALVVEFLLFAGVSVLWWSAGSRPHGSVQSVLLVTSALALGLQSSAVLRLDVPGLSTTYLTGTLTTLVQVLASTRRLRGARRSGLILLALVTGAALGALLAKRAPMTAPLVWLVILGGVIGLASVRLAGRPRPPADPPVPARPIAAGDG